jgi:hypothetical protein
MKIEILGTESLGVRGLCCVVEVKDQKIVMDPGVALGYRRYGLLSHPVQVAVGARVRRRILAELEDATDVVVSHFHWDHIPLPKANPYQLSAQQAALLLRTSRLWAKGPDGLSIHMQRRRAFLARSSLFRVRAPGDLRRGLDGASPSPARGATRPALRREAGCGGLAPSLRPWRCRPGRVPTGGKEHWLKWLIPRLRIAASSLAECCVPRSPAWWRAAF